MSNSIDPTILKDIVSSTMPYGKYKNSLFKYIPVSYLEWMSREGFPSGRLGMILSTTLVIKSNGLEHLLQSKYYIDPNARK